MKDDITFDLDLILTFIHNVMKIESSRYSNRFICRYFKLGVESAEAYLRDMFSENTYNFDELFRKIETYKIYYIWDNFCNCSEGEAINLGRLFVMDIFLDSIKLKEGFI